jgi:prepilin-type N-terminal cleavage/methylation domain-containing protein
MTCKIAKRISNEKAFTLIEVIVCLVLIGIMAAIAGMGLMRIAEGYVFAKQNAETAQKAQIAIARIVKELSYATIINSAPSASYVNYTRPPSATSATSATPYTNIIMFSSLNQNITLQVDSTGTVPGTATTLINNVTNFTLAYFDASGANSIATPAKIRRIDFTLTLKGANNTSIPFDIISVYIQEAY